MDLIGRLFQGNGGLSWGGRLHVEIVVYRAPVVDAGDEAAARRDWARELQAVDHDVDVMGVGGLSDLVGHVVGGIAAGVVFKHQIDGQDVFSRAVVDRPKVDEGAPDRVFALNLLEHDGHGDRRGRR